MGNAMVIRRLSNVRCYSWFVSCIDAHVAFSCAIVVCSWVYLVLSRKPIAGTGVAPLGWSAKTLSCFTLARLCLHPRRLLAERRRLYVRDYPGSHYIGRYRSDGGCKITGHALSTCDASYRAATGGSCDCAAAGQRIQQYAQDNVYCLGDWSARTDG